MWYILFSLTCIGIAAGCIYNKYFRYNDHVTELINFQHDNLKCIKYKYRGKKYIYLTNKMNEDIEWLQKEIDVNSTEKDKIPEIDFKYFKIQISYQNTDDTDDTDDKDEKYDITIEQPNLLYAFVGPSNTYYFAFDTDFNKKLTQFMNYLFFDSAGIVMYGHFSALLEPEKYFEIKNKIDQVKKDNSIIEWSIL